MLSDNIRKYRKSNQMSQDELAEKLEVTRQSISLWETGQTQPSLDNIVALAKLFDVSTDALLTNDVSESVCTDVAGTQINKSIRKKKSVWILTVCFVVVVLLLAFSLLFKKDIFGSDSDNTIQPDNSDVAAMTDVSKTHQSDEDNISQPKLYVKDDNENDSQKAVSENVQTNSSESKKTTQPVLKEANETETASQSIKFENEQVVLSDNEEKAKPVSNEMNDYQDNNKPSVSEKEKEEKQTAHNDSNSNNDNTQSNVVQNIDSVVDTTEKVAEKDLYSYLKNLVIKNGTIRGDYCYLSKSADNYGGYSTEDFSLYYWGDTNKIEFCLHSVLDETFSINFYLYVPVNHTGNYEYISSYYFRDTGEPLYQAEGVINANEFTKNYPLNCNKYIGSSDVQNEFMEMSRRGICDLIECIKKFVTVEKLEYSFKDFGFVNF